VEVCSNVLFLIAGYDSSQLNRVSAVYWLLLRHCVKRDSSVNTVTDYVWSDLSWILAQTRVSLFAIPSRLTLGPNRDLRLSDLGVKWTIRLYAMPRLRKSDVMPLHPHTS
jgi:hypothetical protein